MSEPALAGRVALVTGATRREGIGFAIARELAARGADLFLHHFAPYDRAAPWASGEPAAARLVQELGDDVQVAECEQDLADPQGPERLFERARERFGHVDILVANHAYSRNDGLLELSAEQIDLHLAVNVRASLLLARAFAAAHDDARPGGRIVLLTSGQGLGPMPDEIAYAASKGALQQVTATLADAVAERGITVNTVNPGPTDTGWAGPEDTSFVAQHMPLGRWGRPEDAARLIGWLCSDDARWITGQVIHSEGGFRRWTGS